MKCPICNTELEIGGVDDILRGCPKCRNLGTEMLWQELIDSMKEHDLCYDALIERTKELDRTQKALDIALKGLDDIIDSGGDGYWTAIKTKEQITALEQKDVK